jgi:hypothetical protein
VLLVLRLIPILMQLRSSSKWPVVSPHWGPWACCKSLQVGVLPCLPLPLWKERCRVYMRVNRLQE